MTGAYSGKIVYSGFEWDAPGLDHVSVGLIDSNSNAVPYEGIHEFEWKYAHANGSNANDGDDPTAMYKNGGQAEQEKWGDRLGDSNVQHTYDAVQWVADHYPESYVLPNHVSRHGEGASDSFKVENLRKMNDIAPNNVFGFEGMPGNQMSGSKRGELPESFAGADKAIAQTGGIWDALLSEGRHMWNFANADYHFKVSGNGDYSSGYWPSEYSRNYTYVNDAKGDGYDVKDVVAGLRSGNSFSTYGDIIDKLDFTVSSNGKSATMGQTLAANKTDPVTVTIRFHVPAKNNYQTISNANTGIAASNTPTIDHVDLIRGSVTGKVAEGNYSSTSNADAQIVKTFSKEELGQPDADGYYALTFTDTADHAVYYRVRGVSTSAVDGNGDPVADTQYDGVGDNATRIDDINDQNYASYSFYANPVFVSAQDTDMSYEQLKHQVEDAVAQFDEGSAGTYTAESFAAYRSAAQAVQALLERGDAGRDELKAALDAVTAAKKGLVVAPVEPDKKPDGGSDDKSPNDEKPGDDDSDKKPVEGGSDKKPVEGGSNISGNRPQPNAGSKKSAGQSESDLPKTGDETMGAVLAVAIVGAGLVAVGAGVVSINRRRAER